MQRTKIVKNKARLAFDPKSEKLVKITQK